MKVGNKFVFPTVIDNERPKIISEITKITDKIMDTCLAKTKSFEAYRECAAARLYRLNNVTVDLNAAQMYADIKYKECMAEKKPEAECKERGVDVFMEYFKDYMSRIRKNEPDPEPFIDYEAFNELAEEEAEEDEGGDEEDEDEDEDED